VAARRLLPVFLARLVAAALIALAACWVCGGSIPAAAQKPPRTDAETIRFLEAALPMEEARLGPNHPDVFIIVKALALLYGKKEDYPRAERYWRRALAIREKLSGPDDVLTAESLLWLADTLAEMGRYSEAEPLSRRALLIRTSKLGEHADTAFSLNQLAWSLEQQGKYRAAEPLLRRALAIREKRQGAEHADTIFSLSRLADNLKEQGLYAQAEPLYQRVLSVRERLLGANHADVARVLRELGALYEMQARYKEAEPLFVRALAIREKVLGRTHDSVATLLNDLAWLYFDLGRYAEAEPLYKRALAIREAGLGPAHPYLAKTLNNLGLLYQSEGRYTEAEPLHTRAVAMYEKTLGPEHLEYAEALNNLALLYWRQARYAEAESAYRRSLSIRQKALGPDHPYVGLSLSNIALVYQSQGRYAKAEPLFQRSVTIRENALGPDHPDLAQAINNLATLYEDQGRYADAEPLYRRSLAIYEKAHGPDHPDVALALHNLAGLLDREGRDTDAEPLHRRALAIREKALGPDHPDVATSLNYLGDIYESHERYADAEPLYRRALTIQEKVLGVEHPFVATSLINLAWLYEERGRPAEAEPLYRRALAIRQKAFGPDHPEVATSLSNLARVYVAQGRYPAAEPLYLRALSIREKALGPNHPDIAPILNKLAELYDIQRRYADALPLVRRAIKTHGAATWAALPVLFGARSERLISNEQAMEESLDVAQVALQSTIADTLNKLGARFAAGNGRFADLMRTDQDLAVEAGRLDKTLLEAVSKEPSRRDAASEQRVRDRIAAVAKQREEVQRIIAAEFPRHVALSRPAPLPLSEIQASLADDEAVVVVILSSNASHVWAITNDQSGWQELSVTAAQVAATVRTLRRQLEVTSREPFDTALAYELYRQLLGPVEALIAGKPRLSVIMNGALTSLPPAVLVTGDPAGKTLKEVDWLIRRHALTILPSLASLKVLRSRTAVSSAAKPLIGFADPVFDRNAPRAEPRKMAVLARADAMRGTVANVRMLAPALPALPETGEELEKVAASVGAAATDVFLGEQATETRVKRSKLDDYRIVYFATHGLLAGEVETLAKLKAEPALVLSLPNNPTEFDDGLLTASEAAQLKLNADWVVLSACNTAAGDRPGAEALSGLASAFFYAGSRSLLVSHWPVEVASPVQLMGGTFAAIAGDAKLSHGEALRKSMLAMIDDPERPEWAEPKFWAPFVVVGEPAKPH